MSGSSNFMYNSVQCLCMWAPKMKLRRATICYSKSSLILMFKDVVKTQF